MCTGWSGWYPSSGFSLYLDFLYNLHLQNMHFHHMLIPQQFYGKFWLILLISRFQQICWLLLSCIFEGIDILLVLICDYCCQENTNNHSWNWFTLCSESAFKSWNRSFVDYFVRTFAVFTDMSFIMCAGRLWITVKLHFSFCSQTRRPFQKYSPECYTCSKPAYLHGSWPSFDFLGLQLILNAPKNSCPASQ